MAGFKSLAETKDSQRGVFAGIRKWQIAAAAAVVILLVFGALRGTGIIPWPVTAGEVSTAAAGSEEDPPRRSGGSGMASWAYGFDNLAEMSAFSDLVAVCTVSGTTETERLDHPDTPEYMTRWALKTEQVLKGDAAGQIYTWQLGSSDVPGSDLRDDPLFLPEERYLLFLIESPLGTYYYAGPCGRYLVWEGKVYSMNHILLSGGYQPQGELNFYGAELNTIAARITEIVDSVQLIFTTRREPRMPSNVMRYPAGITLDVNANLSTGNNGPGKITYKINRETLPEGITVSVRPAEFDAEPYTEYESTLIMIVAPDVPPGTYLIPVEYDFEGVGPGCRTITLHINPVNQDDIVTNEDLIERGLKPLGGNENER